MAYGLIYRVSNLINGKVYIGQTVSTLDQRWRSHLCEMRRGKIKSPIYAALRKYGVEAFLVEMIETADSKESLDSAEVAAIKAHNSLSPSHGYNAREGGAAGRLSPEAKAKMSASRSGEKHFQFGKPLSSAHRAKLSEAGKKRTLSPLHKAALIAANTGRKRTPEAHEKLMRSLIGRPMPDNVKAALRAARPERSPLAVELICVTNDRKFSSMREAAKFAGVSASLMTNHVAGKRELASGLVFHKVVKQ